MWVNPAQPPSVSRCAPRSRSPVSLIILTRSCSCRWGPCPSPTPCLVSPFLFIYWARDWGALGKEFTEIKSLSQQAQKTGATTWCNGECYWDSSAWPHHSIACISRIDPPGHLPVPQGPRWRRRGPVLPSSIPPSVHSRLFYFFIRATATSSFLSLVRASPVPSVVRGSFVVKFFLHSLLFVLKKHATRSRMWCVQGLR